ncbi:MAG TPA: hypothetical protein PLF88_00235 [Opitutaceae bacterium]|nr:hypothetical protein [Opitutaceae bacterium]
MLSSAYKFPNVIRRVLIVSPHFPPVNAPDMQRARLALPCLRALGWDPVVLAVTPDSVEGAVLDPLLEQTYPPDIRVVRVRGLSPQLTRPFGFGSLWWRCGRALRQAGDTLLRAEKFDLVFFTTTQFDTVTLGPRWLAKFGVPYVLDYQDPWVNDYYRRTQTRPPGGRVKFWLSQLTARRREPKAVRGAAAIVSVSSAYGPDLLARHPGIEPARIHHLPFGASKADLEIARRHVPDQPLVSLGDKNIHFVYTGRVVAGMRRPLALLFRAFHRYLATHPAQAARIRFHFIGTDYAPPPLAQNWVLPIATAEQVAEHVSEQCYRVPYFEALHYLTSADALLAIGSDDPAYSASKIFPCLLAGRPLLTIAHHESLMLRAARGQNHPASYGFSNADREADTAELVQCIHAEWFVREGYRSLPAGNPTLLAELTAAGMSGRLATIFDGAVQTPSP